MTMLAKQTAAFGPTLTSVPGGCFYALILALCLGCSAPLEEDGS